jgi:curved DNA-binding protein CbpA
MTHFLEVYMAGNTVTVSAYDILGISPDAPQKDVHTALRRLALAWHPDRVPSWRRGEATLRFQSIMDAYNKVRTPDTRKAYDQAFFAGNRAARPKLVLSNDNVPLATRARAWLKALETVFWPVRRQK